MDLKKTLSMPSSTFNMRANLPTKEPIYVKRWHDMNLYQKMLDNRSEDNSFYLHDGPPYANNEIHAGHALNKILKDIIIRFKNLEGYHVPYTPGWDCHGLPIELCVTKSGVDRRTTPPHIFRQKCAEYALKQVAIQKEQMVRLGVIGDYDHPYLTLNKEYEADQLTIFRDMALSGLIYKGLKPVNWSPSSESALAEAEIEYKDVKAKTIFVRFLVTEGNEYVPSGSYFVIWTTTPWTLPANLAICLNPKLEYGLYKTDKGNLVLLQSLSESLKAKLGLAEMELISSFTGDKVENLKTKHPFYDRVSLIINDEYVTADSGTGCVHIAPGHGLDDYRVGKKYNLPPFCPVDEKGYMTEEAGKELANLFYEDCNEKVIQILKDNNSLLALEEITHSYPHDWRTKKPTIFRATKQWFCSIEKIKDLLVKKAEEVSFIPQWGKTRLINMLANREDWCISRQRLWGVPIPIFYGEDGEPLLEKELFDHVIELVRKYGSDIFYEKEAKDLLPEGYTSIHSPHNIFTKEKDIMDVWFDSGSSFLGSGISLKHPYPADVYLEGNDQYRGWYNSSMILSVATRSEKPYKKIITHGFLVDQNGEKFSKSKKNGIDPKTICQNFGADILRLWTATIDYSTAEIKLSQELLKTISEEYRKIRNTFRFMLNNLLDDNEGNKYPIDYVPTSLSLVDKMILNRLNKVLLDMKNSYDNYNFTNACEVLSNFLIYDLSSFYLDFSKDTLYCDKKDASRRRNTQYVLFNIVKKLAIALSPILSFTCEEVYDTLDLKDKKESIALEDYPEIVPEDIELAKKYALLRSIRDKINLLLESARSKGVIGSSSEASLTYSATSEEKEFLEELGEEEAERIFMVSHFAIGDDKVEKHSGTRCDRCWNYFDETIQEDDNHLCKRCYHVVEEK